ncbi:MAG: HEAT repeat domain-containing protein [Planctomycetaceae bacterium]
MSEYSQFPQPPDPLDGREREFGEFPSLEAAELPFVTPPSAGFIVQLFLVPALIVTVVIGVYLLFGRLASGEQDWRKQLTDVRSDNPHLRWRGALGLAQMLQGDMTADGVRLAENRDVAVELANLLQESLHRAATSEDDYKQQEFLTRTLGLLETPEVTFPVLVDAMDPARDREIRKNAIASVATVAHRTHEQGRLLDDRLVVRPMIEATNDSDAMIRHLATYALGFFGEPAAQDRLELLLEHGDELTRANAAFAFARQGSTAGLPVLEEILLANDAAIEAAPSDSGERAASAVEVISLVEAPKLANTVRALDELSGQLEPESRTRLAGLLAPIAKRHADGNIRVAAQMLLEKLSHAR